MFFKKHSFRLKRMQEHARTYFNPMEFGGKSKLRTPMVRIEDHKSEVLSCDIHPSGNFFCSSNRHGEIIIGDICGNFEHSTVLQGYGREVNEARFARHGFDIYSCSADGMVSCWDTFKGYRTAKLEGHIGSANCVNGPRIGYPFVCSGGNDGTVRIWDVREKKSTMMLMNDSEVYTVCFSDNAEYVISGDNGNEVKIWDLRMSKYVHTLRGHMGSVTGIALSPCGNFLLSQSKDNTLRIWDIRNSITFKESVAVFSFHHGSDELLRCAWSSDGTMISAGTSLRDLFVIDSSSGETVHQLSGHEKGINCVIFHQKEPIILSASNDNYIFMHEIP